jgi:hypothetical protein
MIAPTSSAKVPVNAYGAEPASPLILLQERVMGSESLIRRSRSRR